MNAEGGDGPEEPVARTDAQREAPETTSDDVDRQLADAGAITQVHRNVDQTAILISEDRARLILDDLADSLARNRNWATVFTPSRKKLVDATFERMEDRFGLSAGRPLGPSGRNGPAV